MCRATGGELCNSASAAVHSAAVSAPVYPRLLHQHGDASSRSQCKRVLTSVAAYASRRAAGQAAAPSAGAAHAPLAAARAGMHSPPSVTSREVIPPSGQALGDGGPRARRAASPASRSRAVRAAPPGGAALGSSRALGWGAGAGAAGEDTVADRGVPALDDALALTLQPVGAGGARASGVATPTLVLQGTADAVPFRDLTNAAGRQVTINARGGAGAGGQGLVGLAEALRQAAAGARAGNPEPDPESGASAPPSSAASLQRSNPLFEVLGSGFLALNPGPGPASHVSASAADAGSATCAGAPALRDQLSATSGPSSPVELPGSASAAEPMQEQQGSSGAGLMCASALAQGTFCAAGMQMQPPFEGTSMGVGTPHAGSSSGAQAGAGAEGFGHKATGYDAGAAALTPQDAAAGAEGFGHVAAGVDAGAAALTPRAAAAGVDLDAAPLALAFERQAMLDERAELKSELRTISARVRCAPLLRVSWCRPCQDGPGQECAR